MRPRAAIALVIAIALLVSLSGIYALFFQSAGTDNPTTPPPVRTAQMPAPSTAEPPPAARIDVIEVEGDVFKRTGGMDWIKLERGDALAMDEAIRTEAMGRAVLDIGKSATVEISPGSEFTVQEISKTVSRVRLDEGRIAAKVTGLDGANFQVLTKVGDAVAETAKGEFSVLADGKGQLSVAARSGRVRLSAKNKTVDILAGNQAVVMRETAPTAPEPIPESLFLKVEKPKALVVRKKELLVQGKASAGAVVSINSVRVSVDESGRFSHIFPLEEGKNPITVAASDVSGRKREATLPTITVDTKPPNVKSEVKWGQ